MIYAPVLISPLDNAAFDEDVMLFISPGHVLERCLTVEKAQR